MTDTTPPIEAQRYGRSQTPESPRPVHLPEHSSIPVLLNQMDPVFNDTATYNIPHDQNFSPYSNRNFHDASNEEHDAVQDFLRGAEAESALAQNPLSFPLNKDQDTITTHYGTLDSHQTPTIPSSSGQIANPFSTYSSTSPDTGTADILPSSTLDPTSSTNTGDQAKKSEVAPVPAAEPSTAPEIAGGGDGGGVDYSSLLDTLTNSVSTAPAADAIAAPTTAVSDLVSNPLPVSSIRGLPPKPPTQQVSSDLPSQEAQAEPQTSASFLGFNPATQESQNQQAKTQAVGLSAIQHQPSEAAPLPAIPVQNYDQPFTQQNPFPSQIDTSTPYQYAVQMPEISSATERPWTPNTQKVYDQFLEDERRYITEGIWDKFPYGSRLFVGNLPSEKVTKRDLFHIFHRHGRLAQISIKQAYGFVQFLEASSCSLALQADQGVEIRGRRIHLEVSKPQKNTRGSGAGSGGKQNVRRRSRSPDRRGSADRFGGRPPLSDFRDDIGRRREDSIRSSSPRPYRSRDDFRPPIQSPRDFMQANGRPHSPAFAAFPPQPFQQPYDEDAALPLPRRNPNDVPDVQVLILDNNVAQTFINWVENGFRSKGLRVATIWLSQRLPLQVVVKRQILEGVQAVVKLIQHNQFTTKIPLQVFDRSAGVSNVNFNEYVDLEAQVAADIVLHARQRERGPIYQSPQSMHPPTPTYGQPQQYPRPPMPHQPPQSYRPPQPQYQQPRPPQPPPPQYGYPPQQQYQQPPQQSPATPSSAGSANLQQLLANLRQPREGGAPMQNLTPASATRQPDIGGLLSNIAAHQQNQSQVYTPNTPQQAYPLPGQQRYGGGQQSNVQNIMEQLARYQR